MFTFDLYANTSLGQRDNPLHDFLDKSNAQYNRQANFKNKLNLDFIVLNLFWQLEVSNTPIEVLRIIELLYLKLPIAEELSYKYNTRPIVKKFLQINNRTQTSLVCNVCKC